MWTDDARFWSNVGVVMRKAVLVGIMAAMTGCSLYYGTDARSAAPDAAADSESDDSSSRCYKDDAEQSECTVYYAGSYAYFCDVGSEPSAAGCKTLPGSQIECCCPLGKVCGE